MPPIPDLPVQRRRSPRWRSLLHIVAVGLCLLATSITGRAGSPEPVGEYQLKAVFLFQFTQFVEWPTQAFAAAQSPLVIGVLGDDPFGPYLDEVVHDERIRGHPIEVRRYARIEQVERCHILFISASERAHWATIFAALRGRNVLTVSDVGGFARSDGIVLFAMRDGRIRLKVNVAAARAASLTISSKLLRSADIIESARH